jgi:hypothetical protein
MNFSRWIKLMDAAIACIDEGRNREKILEQQLVAKDLEITALQKQLATASTALFANDSELQQLDNKFNQLSSMVLPPDLDD